VNAILKTHQVLRIAKNEVERLTHGWFAVRNRSTKEIKEGVISEGRHRKEKEFFSMMQPWTELKKDRVGINALKSFLGHLLYDHIRSEFPAVVADIRRLSLETQKELEIPGPSRQTPAEQRRFSLEGHAYVSLTSGNANMLWIKQIHAGKWLSWTRVTFHYDWGTE
jgi:hypothetical protein